MNTNDVRNMEVDQWVFWAVALPLTLIIALICLVATGELRNFLANLVGLWMQRKMPLSSSNGGWTVVQGRDYNDRTYVVEHRPVEANRRSRRRRVNVYV